jgi:hypothetical protein
MAKDIRTVSFKNAVIDIDDNTITEYMKDGEEIHSLKKLLEDWDGIENISLTIKKENDANYPY